MNLPAFKKSVAWQTVVMVHVCNPIIWKADPGGKEFESSSELHCNILYQKQKANKIKNENEAIRQYNSQFPRFFEAGEAV
jgi:hypothetical protein